MVCTGATGQEPHFQPKNSLGFKQMKQKSLPHLQCMCLQASVCSISVPQNTHALMEGQPSTSSIFFLGESRRVLRRLSSPEQLAFPHWVLLEPLYHLFRQCKQNSYLSPFLLHGMQVSRISFLSPLSTIDLHFGHSWMPIALNKWFMAIFSSNSAFSSSVKTAKRRTSR